MQDTKNLLKKKKYEYPKLIREAEQKGDADAANYWRNQLKWLNEKIDSRFKNRSKNK